jgi:hypothetical protein
MKIQILGVATALLLCGGCEKEPVSTAPETTNTAGGSEANALPSEVLADPSEVPQGLAGLSLTKNQADLIKGWLEQQGEVADPAESATFVKSVLRDDQQAEFKKIVEAGGR